MDNHDVMDSYESTENALLDSFKAAALKVTTLYKDSLAQNRKAYAAGYQQALQDLYEFLSSTQQPEQGFIPVEDNNQLVTEIKGHSVTPSNNTNTTLSSTPQTAVQPTPPPPPPPPPTSTPTSHLQQQKEIMAQYQKTNPFQIDPHAQFTFTHDFNPNARNHDVWDTAHLSDSNKRRFVPNEFSFMGRSMNLDVWHEQPSPFKRGRTRRDEPSSQEMLLQQQQLQQQQQQQQLQQLHEQQQQQQQQQFAQQQLQQQQQQQQQQQSFQLPFYQPPS
ncbi:hypothetical protein BD560DRAFT_417105 [Blakeslea trispora]|nr:hypothetical protein BD560DRAFT_417105 [Blakeslea trispora]